MVVAVYVAQFLGCDITVLKDMLDHRPGALGSDRFALLDEIGR